jgi:hypothetical protein
VKRKLQHRSSSIVAKNTLSTDEEARIGLLPEVGIFLRSTSGFLPASSSPEPRTKVLPFHGFRGKIPEHNPSWELGGCFQTRRWEYTNSYQSLAAHSRLSGIPQIMSAKRLFRFKRKDGTVAFAKTLPHGSLLIMAGKTQKNFKHEVPQEPGITRPHLHLTFRRIEHK